jgi:hypothetical protein
VLVSNAMPGNGAVQTLNGGVNANANGTQSAPPPATMPPPPPSTNMLPLTGHPGNMAALQLGVLNGVPPALAAAAITAAGATTDPTKEKLPINEYEDAVAKTTGWLEPKKRREVRQLICLKNTDLRAGNDWLVYVSPAEKWKKKVVQRLSID